LQNRKKIEKGEKILVHRLNDNNIGTVHNPTSDVIVLFPGCYKVAGKCEKQKTSGGGFAASHFGYFLRSVFRRDVRIY
jgi:hypothetical protein